MHRPAIFLLLASALLASLVLACGGSDAIGVSREAGAGVRDSANVTDTRRTDAKDSGTVETAHDSGLPHDAGHDSALPYPATSPPLPEVLGSGGPVLTTPRFVPILFSADDPSAIATIGAFISGLGASSYWTTAVGEYGVGAGVATAPVILDSPPPVMIDDSTIQTWLLEELSGAGGDAGPDGGPAFPAPDENTVYALFYPAGTQVTMTSYPGYPPSVSCTDFGAYHNEALPRGSIVYAVIPRCASYLGQTGMGFVTGAASHELIEAATDPHVSTNPAYNDVDFAGSGWDFTTGGPEVGDVCKLDPNAFFMPSGFAFNVQRTWSDVQARGGHDPCVPHLPGEDIYFSAYPTLEGVEVYTDTYASGVALSPGTTRTIDVHLFSDGPTSGPWTVSAAEGGSPQAPPDPEHLLTFSWDKTSGMNGDVLHLTITRKKPSSMMNTIPSLPFSIESKLGTKTNKWWSVVGNP